MIPFTAVVLAAGQGTRMRSAVPKVLHDLCGRPLAAWPVHAAREAGAASVVVVVSPGVDLDGVMPDGTLTAIQPVADGTGGALRAAAGQLDPELPVVVLSGDVPLVPASAIVALVAAHGQSRAVATMATAVLADASGYGRVIRGADGTVERVVETKAPGDAPPAALAINEVNTGILCFDAAALISALPRLNSDNAQGELYLPDVLAILRGDGASVAAHVVDDAALVLGVNDGVDLARVRELARRAIVERHLLAGVTIVDPAHVQIDATVTIDADATIEPGVVLRGATTIATGARVGPNTTVVDSSIGAGAAVLHSWLDRAQVGAAVSVGPFAYLRPGTVLATGAKVGTFVEVKNTSFGENAKAPHLAYIGDADVGAGANLGAGTITANYDGFAKHRTTIGARARVGVDTSLVAPVSVGDDAWTAAGSVITDDVPDGALGVARSRQRNVNGYSSRRGS